MAQRMATWVLWGVITWQRRFLDYRGAQARWVDRGSMCPPPNAAPRIIQHTHRRALLDMCTCLAN
jgi:hypothetical protein